jgi:GNAT superfamily N-acetyltransferase
MCRAGVVRSHRGKGLQKRLIRVRERKAREHGWKWLITDTASYNVASSNNLAACGFKLFRPSRPWGHDDGLYWRKAL